MEATEMLCEPDWNAVRESYMQGKPIEEIAQRHNVSLYAIRSRAQKQGWREMQVAALAFARQEVSERIRNSLIASVLRDSIVFESYAMPAPPTPEHEIASRNRARLIDSASKLLNWQLEAGADPLDKLKSARTLDV